MAKIKGIELKNVKEFRGHEGEILEQGDVYYKGKKVGFWSQDGWGGCDNFNLDYNLDKDLKVEINNILNNYQGNILFKGIDDLYREKYNIKFNYEHKGYECLFEDLIQLREHESLYKKYSKKFNSSKIVIIYKDLFQRAISNVIDTNRLCYEYNSLKDFIIN